MGGGALFTAETGAVQGVVTDESLFPINGASVQIVGTNATAITDVAGSFSFSYVLPGQLTVEASLPGYVNASQQAEVSAAQIARVRLVLAPLPSATPYVMLELRDAFIPCTWALVFALYTCDVNGVIASDDSNILVSEIPAGHQAILVEADWSPASIYVVNTILLADRPADADMARGPYIKQPPLRAEFLSGTSNDGGAHGERGLAPESASGFRLQSAYSSGGQYWNEVNGTLGPVCHAYYQQFYGRPTDCFGVGITVDLRIHQYLSVFVHALRDDWRTASAMPDA